MSKLKYTRPGELQGFCLSRTVSLHWKFGTVFLRVNLSDLAKCISQILQNVCCRCCRINFDNLTAAGILSAWFFVGQSGHVERRKPGCCSRSRRRRRNTRTRRRRRKSRRRSRRSCGDASEEWWRVHCHQCCPHPWQVTTSFYLFFWGWHLSALSLVIFIGDLLVFWAGTYLHFLWWYLLVTTLFQFFWVNSLHIATGDISTVWLPLSFGWEVSEQWP